MRTIFDAVAGRYIAIRRLIKVGFRVLRKHLPDCPNTPGELFFEVVEEERNLPFESKIVNDFVEYRPSQLSKFHLEMSKQDFDISKAQKFRPHHGKTRAKEEALIDRIVSCLIDV